MNIEIFSFFAGLGFLDLGFENAGLNITFVNEFNKNFLDAYRYARKNNKTSPRYGYSSKNADEYLDDSIWNTTFPDYNDRKNKLIGFIGGPPCPDFSIAGKNKGENGLNGRLTEVYFKLIKARLPDFFVFENVKGLYNTKKHREFYDRMKNQLKSSYKLFDSVENALEYGVPQYRERLLLVGFKSETFKNIHFDINTNKKYFIDDVKKLSWPDVSPFVIDKSTEKPNNIIEDITVEYWFKKNDVDTHPNQKDIFRIQNKERFYLISEGDVTRKSFKRLHRWRYSPTAAYGNNEVHLHPYRPRRISVAEALAIQSLPKEFEVLPELTLSEKFKMVGNGVPYLLSLSVAQNIKDSIIKFVEQEA